MGSSIGGNPLVSQTPPSPLERPAHRDDLN
jgi:hypothetical protein